MFGDRVILYSIAIGSCRGVYVWRKLDGLVSLMRRQLTGYYRTQLATSAGYDSLANVAILPLKCQCEISFVVGQRAPAFNKYTSM